MLVSAIDEHLAANIPTLNSQWLYFPIQKTSTFNLKANRKSTDDPSFIFKSLGVQICELFLWNLLPSNTFSKMNVEELALEVTPVYIISKFFL